jgi:selenide,water dikinase
VHPQKYFTKGGAKPGDVLVLTKPLGTGTISTALKRGVADENHVTKMVAWMKKLNRCAAQAAQATGEIRSVTDITGFGLLGHSLEMTKASGIQFEFEFSRIPFLDGATDYAAEFIFPGGTSNNRLHFEKEVTFAPDISEEQQMLLWDAQTSGGLLLAIPPHQLETFQAACARHKQTMWVVGHVQTGSGITVKV